MSRAKASCKHTNREIALEAMSSISTTHVHVHTFVCIRTCVHTNTDILGCAHIYMHIHIHTHAYLYTYTCLHTCGRILTQALP